MLKPNEALQEFRKRNKQLTDEFNRIMELEKLILSQMTMDRTIEEIQHLDQMASCCEVVAREILKKADILSGDMRSYLEKMTGEPL